MRLAVRNPKDFWSGVIFAVAGIAFGVIAQDYEMGTALKMGPAYFPTMLAGLLVLVGLGVALRGFVIEGQGVPRFASRALLLVIAAALLFGVFLREVGLAISLLLVVLLSAAASVHFRWPVAIALAIGLTVFCILLFVEGLGLPIPLIGRWLAG